MPIKKNTTRAKAATKSKPRGRPPGKKTATAKPKPKAQVKANQKAKQRPTGRIYDDGKEHPDWDAMTDDEVFEAQDDAHRREYNGEDVDWSKVPYR